jgi:predicted nucleotidyltransferase component of viral defense system
VITRDEIREVAASVRLQPAIVEKDYALGWMLAGINSHALLGQRWIFKGGTCLKKCYFETYRFSEDLDFSCPADGIPTEEELVKIFSEISDWIMKTAGLEIPKMG